MTADEAAEEQVPRMWLGFHISVSENWENLRLSLK